MKNAFYPFLILAVLITSSCKDDDDNRESIDYKFDYFPTTLGLERFYKVDSLVIRENDPITDTFSYQIREVFREYTTDNEGEQAIIVDRYYRQHDTNDWQINHVFTIKLSGKEAQQNFNNVRELKLVFPPEVGTRWNGNRYNSMDEQDYEVTKIEETTVPFGIPTDVLTVVQKDETNFIERKYDEERYVRGIGMIFKEHIDIETQTNDTFGVIYRYHLIDYTF